MVYCKHCRRIGHKTDQCRFRWAAQINVPPEDEKLFKLTLSVFKTANRLPLDFYVGEFGIHWECEPPGGRFDENGDEYEVKCVACDVMIDMSEPETPLFYLIRVPERVGHELRAIGLREVPAAGDIECEDLFDDYRQVGTRLCFADINAYERLSLWPVVSEGFCRDCMYRSIDHFACQMANMLIVCMPILIPHQLPGPLYRIVASYLVGYQYTASL